MKRIIMKLVPGLLFSLLLAVLGISIYTFNLYLKASPGFKVTKEYKVYSAAERKEVIEALVKLSQLAESFGLRKSYTTFSASAGGMYGENRDSASILTAKYYFSIAIETANQVAISDKNYHPILEAYFTYGLFLKDIGENETAIKIFNTAIEIGLQNDPQNYWIKNLERALVFAKTHS